MTVEDFDYLVELMGPLLERYHYHPLLRLYRTRLLALNATVPWPTRKNVTGNATVSYTPLPSTAAIA